MPPSSLIRQAVANGPGAAVVLVSPSEECVGADVLAEDSLALCRGRDITMLSSPGIIEGERKILLK